MNKAVFNGPVLSLCICGRGGLCALLVSVFSLVYFTDRVPMSQNLVGGTVLSLCHSLRNGLLGTPDSHLKSLLLKKYNLIQLKCITAKHTSSIIPDMTSQQ